VLSEVFRGKFLEALQQAHASGQLQFHGLLRGLAQPKLFRSLIRQLFRSAMGCLLQTAVRRPRSGASLLGRLHPSRCDFQSPTRFLRR
jgi:hypothetical protein